jgi:hypothetical protein
MSKGVVAARRPLQTSDLRTTPAIEIGKPVSTWRCLPKFDTTLGKMSGALIEVAKDGSVRFIHLAVIEIVAGN